MILVDDRVGSKELFPLIKSPKVRCHLDFADFAFGGNGPEGPINIGVERKTVEDLMSSMRSGRLSGHQIIGMRKEYDRIYVLIERPVRCNPKTGLLESAKYWQKRWRPVGHGKKRYLAKNFWNYINSLQMIAGITVVYTHTKTESARWIDSTFMWWNKEWSDHQSHEMTYDPGLFAQLRKPNLTTRVAMQFQGVGSKLAKRIGERFKTPKELFSSYVEELQEVEGISHNKAMSIYRQYEEGK